MIKKVLLINGSPNEHGCTDVALLEAAASLNKNGIETEILWLKTEKGGKFRNVH